LRGANGPSGLGCLSGWAVRMRQLAVRMRQLGRCGWVDWSRGRCCAQISFMCLGR
jgi:hypothetical protein